MAVSARRGRALSTEEIYLTALRLVDEGGVDGLSMRKLAAELDVNPMSLYHHVDSKTALISQLCAMAANRLELPPDDGTPWQDQLRALGHAERRLAKLHPALWSYISSHPESLHKESGVWQVLTRNLLAAGVPATELDATCEALFAFVSGFVTAENNQTIGFRAGTEDVDRTFEIAVDIILAGLSHRHSPAT
ncbi:TetR family transcriptional regulator [Streptosporangium soli]|nr:TetR family transcriptional regulator [Streptosporangium sp. KLBMP 9127]